MAYEGPIVETVNGGTGLSSPGASGNVLTSNGTIWTSAPGSGIGSINGDTGSISGSTLTIFTNKSSNNSGATFLFSNSGTTSTLNVSDANDNTFFGENCGVAGMAVNNTAYGAEAMQLANVASVANTAVGVTALRLVNGSENTAIGFGAGIGVVAGSANTFVGAETGNSYTTTESNNIIIGAKVLGTIGDNNQIRIGNQGSGTGQQNKCQIAGITGASVAGSPVYCDSSGNLGTISLGTSVILEDDFIGFNSSTTTLNSNLSWQIDATNGFNVAGTANNAHPGTITHGAMVGAGSAYIALGQSAENLGGIIVGSGAITIDCIFKVNTLNDVTNNYQIGFGLFQSVVSYGNTIILSNNANNNSGNWVASTYDGGGSSISSAIALSTGWNHLTITINAAATSVDFIINGVDIGTIVANIPLTALVPGFSIQYISGTVSAASIEIDLFKMTQVLTTSR